MQHLRNLYQQNKFNSSNESSITLWILIGIAIVAYLLPWINHSTVSFALDAYDLAEWTSLHPLMRISEPVLLASLLLRLLPVLMALLISVNAPRPVFRRIGWWASLLFVLLTAFALLPPLEFFTDANQRFDVNYRQQFQLVVATLGGGAIGLSGVFYPLRYIINIILAFIGLYASYRAITESVDIIEWSGIVVSTGVGGIIMGLVLCGVIGYSLWKIKQAMTTL